MVHQVPHMLTKWTLDSQLTTFCTFSIKSAVAGVNLKQA